MTTRRAQAHQPVEAVGLGHHPSGGLEQRRVYEGHVARARLALVTSGACGPLKHELSDGVTPNGAAQARHAAVAVVFVGQQTFELGLGTAGFCVLPVSVCF